MTFPKKIIINNIVIPPPKPVQKKLVMALSCLEAYLVKIRYNANIDAPINAKIEPIEKMLKPGLYIIRTPMKPKNIALQRLQPNFSPRKGTERPATISG